MKMFTKTIFNINWKLKYRIQCSLNALNENIYLLFLKINQLLTQTKLIYKIGQLKDT